MQAMKILVDCISFNAQLRTSVKKLTGGKNKFNDRKILY